MDKQAFKRKENWTSEETSALVQAVADSRDTIVGKLTNAVSNELKAKTWEDVTRRVNAVSSSVERETKEVKKKWQTFQSTVKTKEMKRRKEAGGTGGGPPPNEISQTEKCALAIIPETMMSGIGGGIDTGCSNDDSDDQPRSIPSTSTLSVEPTIPRQILSLIELQRPSTSTSEPPMQESISTISTPPERRQGTPLGRRQGKRKTSCNTDEDYQSKLLKIEERKLQIKEQKLLVLREQCDAIKEIAFSIQAGHLNGLLFPTLNEK